MACKSFPSLWNLEKTLCLLLSLGDFKWPNKERISLGEIAVEQETSRLPDMPVPPITDQLLELSQQNKSKSHKTNCALCSNNPRAYKLSSENNLKVITELLIQTLHPPNSPPFGWCIHQQNLSFRLPLRPTASSGSQGPPITRPFSLPLYARWMLRPRWPGVHVLRMAVPLSTWVPEWLHGARHILLTTPTATNQVHTHQTFYEQEISIYYVKSLRFGNVSIKAAGVTLSY